VTPLKLHSARREEPAEFDVNEAVSVIRKRTVLVPRTALVLGSGLGVMAEGVAWDRSFPTEEVPGLPAPPWRPRGKAPLRPLVRPERGGGAGTLPSLRGLLPEEVTRLVRLFAALGAKSLVLTNASGGIAPRMAPGTLMLVEDQVSLQWRAPQLATAAPPRGLRSRPVYSADLLGKAARAAVNAGVRVERGILGVTLGASYETRAEIRMLERMGADAVCMSTASRSPRPTRSGSRRVHLLHHQLGRGQEPEPLRHEDVTAGVAAVAPAIRSVIERLLLALS